MFECQVSEIVWQVKILCVCEQSEKSDVFFRIRLLMNKIVVGRYRR